MPTIKVKLAKTFSMDSHNRAGITVVRGAAQTFEVDDEQYVKICDDPAFDVDTVDGSASDDADTTNTEETQTETTETTQDDVQTSEQPQTTTQNGAETNTDSSSEEEGQETAQNASEQETTENTTEDTEVKPETASQLKKNHNRDELVAMASDLGVEVVEADTKATLADKIVAKRGE